MGLDQTWAWDGTNCQHVVKVLVYAVVAVAHWQPEAKDANTGLPVYTPEDHRGMRVPYVHVVTSSVLCLIRLLVKEQRLLDTIVESPHDPLPLDALHLPTVRIIQAEGGLRFVEALLRFTFRRDGQWVHPGTAEDQQLFSLTWADSQLATARLLACLCKQMTPPADRPAAMSLLGTLRKVLYMLGNTSGQASWQVDRRIGACICSVLQWVLLAQQRPSEDDDGEYEDDDDEDDEDDEDDDVNDDAAATCEPNAAGGCADPEWSELLRHASAWMLPPIFLLPFEAGTAEQALTCISAMLASWIRRPAADGALGPVAARLLFATSKQLLAMDFFQGHLCQHHASTVHCILTCLWDMTLRMYVDVGQPMSSDHPARTVVATGLLGQLSKIICRLWESDVCPGLFILLSKGEPKEALKHCKAALKLDKRSYEAYLLIGKAAFELGEHGQADLAYRKAIEVDAVRPAAWKGLAELHKATKDTNQLVEAYEHLVALAGADQAAEPQPNYRQALADAYLAAGQPAQALSQYRALLQPEQPVPERLQLLCRIADTQDQLQQGAAAPADASGAAAQNLAGADIATLEEIAVLCGASAPLAPYHEELLRRQVAAYLDLPTTSPERLSTAVALLRACHRLMTRQPGGCCSALPYETTAWLLAALCESEEGRSSAAGALGCNPDAVVAAFDRHSRRFAHQFPWLGSAAVAASLGLLRQHRSDTQGASKAAQRRRIGQWLARGVATFQAGVAASVALADLQLSTNQPQAALDTATRAAALHAKRQKQGYPAAPSASLYLKLLAAQCLLQLGRVDPAHAAVTEAAHLAQETDVIPGQLWGSRPVSARHLSMRGLAQVALAGGDATSAKMLTEAIMAEVSPSGESDVEYWTHADYGKLLAAEGLHEAALDQFELALDIASSQGAQVTDFDLAGIHYHTARTRWALGGAQRTERGNAHANLLAAAAVEGAPDQAAAFAWLGHYYREVAGDALRARKCYQRALALDPTLASAGEALCSLLKAAGSADTALALCEEFTKRAPQALWAWRRLGFLQLQTGQAEAAVVAFQNALRADVGHAAAWEGLGSAYQSLGRLTAALKSYGRAVELQPARLYSLVQSGIINVALGAFPAAEAAYEAALGVSEDHPPALLGAGETLLAAARQHLRMGAAGIAAKQLGRAASYALRCAAHAGNLLAVWKLLGDVQLQYHAVTPAESLPRAVATLDAAKTGQEKVAVLTARWQMRLGAMQSARRAYAKALHLAPSTAELWGDAGATFYHEAQLRRAHASLHAQNAPALRSAGKRLIRGGLRINPSSASLWAALGSTALSPTVQEYAFSRSLQLDPKGAATWAALGRLYCEHGAPDLADRCFIQARSHEPASAATWEAMGALAGLSPTGAEDKMNAHEHASKLGAGPEAFLGFAEGALRKGQGASGAVYAAARRAIHLQPLNAAAYSALGAAAEARGAYGAAVTAYQTAQALLASSSGGAAPQGPSPDNFSGPTVTVNTRGAAPDVATTLRLNLARALGLAGRLSEAADLYNQLEFQEVLEGKPEAWASYAHVLLSKGNARGCEKALLSGLRAQPKPGVYAALVRSLCQLHISQGSLDKALTTLQQHLQGLLDCKAPLCTMEPLWLTLLAGAVASTKAGATADVLGLLHGWRLAVDHDTAEFAAAVQSILAAGSQRQRRWAEAKARRARALHLAPWQPALYAALANAALTASPAYAWPARHLCLLRGLDRLDSRTVPSEVVRRALTVRASGVVAESAGAVRHAAEQDMQVLTRWVHAEPHSLRAWYLLSLRQVARCRAAVGSWAEAEAAYRSALTAPPLPVPDAGTALELAQLLSRQSRHQEAASLLQQAMVGLQGTQSQVVEADASFGIGLQGHVALLLLRQAEEQAALGDRTQALHSSATAQMVSEAVGASWRSQPHVVGLDAPGQAGRVLEGAVHLVQAAAGDEDSRAAAVGSARKVLTEAQGRSWSNSAIVRMLLAQGEALGTVRKKSERVEQHVTQALNLWPRPIPPDVLALGARLCGSVALSAKALHAAPWNDKLAAQLHTLIA
ncbi:hypothetical protein WJX72_001132 [[Myrmecia] bisecta]|uniref:Tetratricopeptide repeat protein 37 n=1 Tax=[Myrmecia] bisecta TaxID=41462 RepID=A0AAW1PKQ8_9CHLO